MSTSCPQVFLTWGICLVLICQLFTSCAAPQMKEDWNHLKIWQQVSSNPPTYIPAGYGIRPPRTEHDGTWYTDERDGKRLFVPKTAVGRLSPGMLTGEAKKATGYDDGSNRLSTGEKATWGLLAFFAALGQSKLPAPD